MKTRWDMPGTNETVMDFADRLEVQFGAKGAPTTIPKTICREDGTIFGFAYYDGKTRQWRRIPKTVIQPKIWFDTQRGRIDVYFSDEEPRSMASYVRGLMKKARTHFDSR